MREDLCKILCCPICYGELDWTVGERSGDHIEEGEARCKGCGAHYPVREGIGLFLTSDLPRRDLWEQVDSELALYLREHPEVERRLLQAPLETLGPADLFFRALVLEERGRLAEARAAAKRAQIGLYTPEYRACYESQLHHVVRHLSSSADKDEPIIDLASGQGELVERLARGLSQPIVATDFSPRVLRRDRRFFEFLGLEAQISLLAFDARKTPFKDGAIKTMTTNLGLANVEHPGDLLKELRRIISGEFLAIVCFYPEDDEANAAAIRELGLEPFLYRDSALELFAEAGFEVKLENVRKGRALPTPKSEILEGAGIDALPVAETELEWGTLVAS